MSTRTSQNLPRPGRPDPEEARRRLEQERRNRLSQLEALREDEESASDEIVDIQQTSIRRVLTEIDAALERVEAGAYGLCLRCERPIPAERLEILPYAGRCVGCQQRSR
jgi:DnaK suppressor protein